MRGGSMHGGLSRNDRGDRRERGSYNSGLESSGGFSGKGSYSDRNEGRPPRKHSNHENGGDSPSERSYRGGKSTVFLKKLKKRHIITNKKKITNKGYDEKGTRPRENGMNNMRDSGNMRVSRRPINKEDMRSHYSSGRGGGMGRGGHDRGGHERGGHDRGGHDHGGHDRGGPERGSNGRNPYNGGKSRFSNNSGGPPGKFYSEVCLYI